MDSININVKTNVLNKKENLEKDIFYRLSDQYHLNKFLQTKFSWLIYLPIVGTFLLISLFQKQVLVNLIDRKLISKGKTKFMIFLALPFIVFALITMILAFILFLHPNLSIWTVESRIWILLFVDLFLLFWSSATNRIVIQNLASVLNIDETIDFPDDFEPYFNSQIIDNGKYFKNLYSSRNKRLNRYSLSENLKSIHEVEINSDYRKSLFADKKEYKLWDENKATLSRFTKSDKKKDLSIPFSWFFNYFSFVGTLNQKAINDKKISLSKKLNNLILINWIFDILVTISLFVFLSSIYTGFSYLQNLSGASDLNNTVLVSNDFIYNVNDVILHWIYFLLFVLSFSVVSLFRNIIVKSVAIKWCTKEYLNEK
ncbi:hypothetical protein SAMN02745179_00175 [Mycoplasmopsis agassizii]|nr:hypothetical protein SAMN02745179_00175 [Mycoplasmopsis agassizii]